MIAAQEKRIREARKLATKLQNSGASAIASKARNLSSRSTLLNSVDLREMEKEATRVANAALELAVALQAVRASLPA